MQTLTSSSHEPPMEPRSYVEPGSKHSVFTHFAKDPNCGKKLEDQKTQGLLAEAALTQSCTGAENFGDLITADLKVPSEESESRSNQRYAVVVQDLATQWLQSYPFKTKSSQETKKSLMKFPGADEETKSHLH